MIFAVVGKSGSGKTTAAEFAGKALGIPVICSYTTRKMREGEVDGREHYFVDESSMPCKEDMMAYTYFGGHHYWTTKEQFEGDCIYVVDEEGLRMMLGKYDVMPMYIERKSIDVDAERQKRDNGRQMMVWRTYKAIVYNNGTLERFLFDFTLAVSVLKTEPSMKEKNHQYVCGVG